jgi:hypothetical protein
VIFIFGGLFSDSSEVFRVNYGSRKAVRNWTVERKMEISLKAFQQKYTFPAGDLLKSSLSMFVEK